MEADVLAAVTDGAFRPVAVCRACRDKALLLMAGSFGAALVTVSLGPLGVAEPRGFAELWLPTGGAILLGCSSDLGPAGAGAPGDTGEALLVAPLFSLLPSDEELRLVGNPLTGSFEVGVVAGRPAEPDAGC